MATCDFILAYMSAYQKLVKQYSLLMYSYQFGTRFYFLFQLTTYKIFGHGPSIILNKMDGENCLHFV